MSAAMLLANGADPNLPQPGNSSPLHVAALRGSRDIVEFLIRKGAAVDALDGNGRTARALAESAGHLQVAALLERHREIPRDHSSSRAAYDASGGAYRAPDLSAYSSIKRERVVGASHGKLEVVRETVEQHPALAHSMATTTERAVEACAHTGRHDIVDYLLSKGAPCSLPTATMRNDVARVRALLKEDPLRVHERGAHDFALLWYTVIGGGSTEIAELLLQHGAEVERQHWLGTTALHWAARDGNLDMATLFLEHGADVNRVGRKFDKKGETPLQLAETPEMAKLLRDHGARG
jgi:ankyrin repeat protein